MVFVLATPYNQLPLMEVDGAAIPQSCAQLRYAGKVGDMYPTDPVQAAFADAAVSAVMDIHGPMRASIMEKDNEKKVQYDSNLQQQQQQMLVLL